jgi:acyl-CoA thioester hydrolase
MSAWRETYRGTVYRWEVDLNDHLTVAYYLQRLADAGLDLLDRLGLGADATRAAGRACVTDDVYIRYLRELRVGDVLHVRSGFVAVEPDGLHLGHKLFDSDGEVLCATFEQHVRHVDAASGQPVPLPPAARDAAAGGRVPWDGPARERRPPPCGDGFRDTGRDTVKPWEIDVAGGPGLAHLIHRFSAANAQAVAALGMTPAYQRDARRGFSTFEFQLAVPGTLRAGDAVAVQTALLHVGTSSLRLHHRMLAARTGRVVATLDQLGVHLDLDGRRPAPLPDALRDKARALLAPPAASA